MIICLATGISAIFSFRVVIIIFAVIAMYVPELPQLSARIHADDFC